MPLATLVTPTLMVPADAVMVQVPPRAQFWPFTVVDVAGAPVSCEYGNDNDESVVNVELLDAVTLAAVPVVL